jgi:hypothetical protein
VTDDDPADLESVVSALNRVLPKRLSDEDHKALVDFVELWNRSGRAPVNEPFHSATEGRPFKLTRLLNGAFEKHPVSKRMVENADAKRFWRQHGTRFSRQSLEKAFQWRIAAGPAGGCWYKTTSVTPWGPSDPAVLLAARLHGNTLSAKLSDKPCHRCNKWFVKKRAVQKCCSKHCATDFNNTVGVRNRRAADHEEQLDRARAALKSWKRTDRHTDWKQFVSNETYLTPRFLTRAVNKGELRAPRISKKRRKT